MDQLKYPVWTVFWCQKLNHKDRDLVYENKLFQVIGNIGCVHIIRSRHHTYSLKYVRYYLPQIPPENRKVHFKCWKYNMAEIRSRLKEFKIKFSCDKVLFLLMYSFVSLRFWNVQLGRANPHCTMFSYTMERLTNSAWESLQEVIDMKLPSKDWAWGIQVL